jgi:hypothetical protein
MTFTLESVAAFAFVGMDLLTTLYLYCVSDKKDFIEKYQKEHPKY